MKLRGIIHTVSDFLFSKANREFLIFLAFFALAGIFWMLMALNDSYEQEVRIPIRYTGIPKSVVMTSSETDTIRATIQDKGIVLLTYLYGDALKEITTDFRTYAGHRGGRGEITTAELSKMVSQQLAASSKLISIKPDRLTFFYNFGEKKRVPVKWTGTVIPEDIYFLSSTQIDEDSITIYASRERLDSITAVNTLPLNYTDFHDTLVVTTGLQKIAGVKMVPETVTIRFITDILTEERIDNIPIVGINMPEGAVLRTFPAKTSVKFVTGVKTYQSLSSADFSIVADYRDILKAKSDKCKIRLVKTPKNISRVKLEIEEVDYLIEKQQP